MSTRQYGTFLVRDREVCTVYVKAGDRVTVSAPAGDRVRLGGAFGFWAGEAGPDGRPERAGDNFPAPALRRYSLIFRIGYSAWQQGGSNAPAVTAPVDGQVVLHINDDLLNDNSGGWNATVTRTTAETIDDLPRAGSGALLQSIDGNMRMIATGNRRVNYDDELNLLSFERNRAFQWRRIGRVTAIFYGTQGRDDTALRWPSWFQATDGQLWCVCVQGTQVKCFALETPPTDVPGADDCVGPPALIQSQFGNLVEFHLVYPAQNGRMKHRFAETKNRSCDLRAPLNWDPEVKPLGSPAFKVLAVRLLQSDWGNLEVIAVERAASGAVQLKHWWRNNATRVWDADPVKSVLPRSNEIRENGIPAFIQSSFRTGSGPHGNYEVIAPARNGGLMHWYFDFGTWEGWRLRLINERGPVVRAVHLLQANFGARRNNFELVAETGEPLLWSLNSLPLGYGRLIFYWCNNDRANNSHDGIWSGPNNLTFPGDASA